MIVLFCLPSRRGETRQGGLAIMGRMDGKKRKTVVIPRPDVNAIEADVAYFEARLSFARRGEQTVYNLAQQRVYQALSGELTETLKKLRK